ncbi:uncharacterized protein LOC132295919 [Cornus florida]|uniref:uncharacterized protein LOC132295919 n=1 Tax=Cornus florida TaxID=4283 RepID=UPI0028A1637D|nr:uncharacterized protein LOC132295919 [Cornus florida]
MKSYGRTEGTTSYNEMFNFSKHKLKDEEEAFCCGICCETMFATSTNKFENDCTCPCSFCNDCIAKHIKVSIEEYNRGKIRCPRCDQLLDPLSCRHIIPAPLFDKWCDKLCNLAVLELDTCYCPYRDCLALVVTECGVGDLVRRSKCPHCKRLFCFQCKQPWHADYECEYSSSDMEFGVVEKREKWMRCPACKHCVERAKGCRIIHCRLVVATNRTAMEKRSSVDTSRGSWTERNFSRICIWESDGEAGDITCDIIDNIEASMLYRDGSKSDRDGVNQFRKGPCCFTGEVSKLGQTISKGYKNYDLMLNLQLGSS